jgi:hypothetical protein
VAAQDEPALEPEQQVLSDRLDRLEPSPVQALRDPRRRGARMGRLDREGLADKHLQALRRAMQGVAFGHGASLWEASKQGRCPSASNGGRPAMTNHPLTGHWLWLREQREQEREADQAEKPAAVPPPTPLAASAASASRN